MAAGIPEALLTDAPAHLVASPATSTSSSRSMGGDEPARTLVAAGARRRASAVVTANKHLVAHHGPELERRRARGRQPAAVRGGGRRRHPASSARSRWTSPRTAIARVRGIVNGTTNFILTAMAREGRDYADVLAEAQARGYAEADPTADVEGLDARQQARDPRAARVRRVDRSRRRSSNRPGTTRGGDGAARASPASPPTTSPRWPPRAASLRLIATARLAEDGAIEASVVPTAVPAGSPFGRCDGVLNRVEVDAVPVGRVAFEGPGAGGPADGRRRCSATSSRSRAGSARPGPALPPAHGALGDRRPPVAGECVAAPSGACYPVRRLRRP